ncbi:hypothetical protein T265_09819 [Opisthorchis viverrini]|uniref:Uncharacterized protein n=1 Tax=Opisthorchis viverrini TaxID=6198 RepID=A0A075A3L4_OPIVI|nr:hypothetical protein T265_09819 [Opisthorchis viverrini]KER21989.1 hypothetical protein T265_09819 [Opisthorchis viverrini]
MCTSSVSPGIIEESAFVNSHTLATQPDTVHGAQDSSVVNAQTSQLKPGKPGSILALILASSGMADRQREVARAERLAISDLERRFINEELSGLRRSVRGSNPTSATRLPLSRLGQPGSIPALVLPPGGMAARHRKGATAERF